ncbi:hypothetical protein [Leptospira noguchii]|uniref:Uncharacterized protein n=1 Tax=Leptospira noguchii TaxID=28182 RepID=A0A9Q8RND9_9LEPT|nr:hypothetical protein [Leptospira noguchii]TQE69565.1 hypothetical protein FF021_15595 [Leptospira noguchii]UOG54617.1 hypothetical protein MAL09_20470 [Leptospira noguchii]UOG58654.1 hypothetical protein MAL03_18500 [Leptospira noguchii]
MEFEIWFSFMAGVSVTALCLFADHSDLKSKRQKKKHEFNEEFINLFIELDLKSQLNILLTSLRMHDQLLKTIFETDKDCDDHLSIAVALSRLMEKIEAKIEKLEKDV